MPSQHPPPPPHVPRETNDKLRAFESLVHKWQKRVNLLSRSNTALWDRHILDSLQLAEHLLSPTHKVVFDLGSGGGFPGIILACALPHHHFYLIESDRKKAIFLSEAVRHLGLNNTFVVNRRIEEHIGKADIITARALADVSLLLEYSHRFFHTETYCLFLKGKNYAKEIAQAQQDWRFEWEAFPSRTSEGGAALKLSQLCRINR